MKTSVSTSRGVVAVLALTLTLPFSAQAPKNQVVKLTYASTVSTPTKPFYTQFAIEYEKAKAVQIKLKGKALDVFWSPKSLKVVKYDDSKIGISRVKTKDVTEEWNKGSRTELPKTLNHRFALTLLGQEPVESALKGFKLESTQGGVSLYRAGGQLVEVHRIGGVPFNSIQQTWIQNGRRITTRLQADGWMKIQGRDVATEFYMLDYSQDGSIKSETHYKAVGLRSADSVKT